MTVIAKINLFHSIIIILQGYCDFYKRGLSF